MNKSAWRQRIEDDLIQNVFTEMLKKQYFTDEENWVLVYDLDLYLERLEYLRGVFSKDTIHTLAIKSCPLVSILKEAVRCGFGLEAASLEEVYLALSADCPADKIVFDSPAKTKSELTFALQNGVRINVDNFDELRYLSEIRLADCKSNIGIRVNPEVGEGSISMTAVAGDNSKFGISIISNRTEIVDAFRKYSWLDGLHVHIGSQGCDLDQLVSAAKNVNRLKDEINDALMTRRINWIDIGGGLPADYGFNKKAIEVTKYAERLKKVVPGLFEQTILTEFGRSILANCAWAVSRIQYIKKSRLIQTCVIHFGADFLMRPVYAADEWKHKYIVLDSLGRKSTARKTRLSIAGPLCFAGDYLQKNNLYPGPEAEGFIAVKDVGAYTLSMWSRHCNRRLPKVLGYKKCGNKFDFTTLYRGESMEDVVKFWS